MPEENEENAITYETFRKFQRREKNNEKLQDLPDDFFKHCIEWLNRKQEKFDETNESTLLHEIENVKSIVKDIFNRRRRKILQLALHSVRSNKVSKNLLPEEKQFFDTIVDQLEELEEKLLKRILKGKKPTTAKKADYNNVENEKISKSENNDEKKENKKQSKNVSDEDKEEVNDDQHNNTEKGKNAEKKDTTEEKDERLEKLDVTNKGEHQLVRVVEDVDKFAYDEDRSYGPLKEGDLVTLPQDVAELLEKKDHVEYTEI